ncbi:Photosynthetic NDH subunit of lumenal location 1, chloroplastic [Sesamum alatum]|uniref:Photosynthetic NDH subunit of lumenal location 1, chloroplastic n=1 Tax=Sesamum alatum TaxID=300844 RepID=A0AAE1Y7N2_9LAMI|nr:Photosynthetic NDH subunit of lumenal location 1, chloroplastic [Sesamum alatum]
MAVSSLSLTFISEPLTNKLLVRSWTSSAECGAVSSHAVIKCSRSAASAEDKTKCTVSANCKRRELILGIGALTVNLLPASPLLAEGKLENYQAFVDKVDGYSYYYPSDWRDFDFRGHDSAFKDRYLQLQNVRLSFIPTDKTDIHDMGPMEEVVANLVTNVYSAPTQVATILDMQERNIDGRNYWTFEYILTSPNFARAAFATIAVGNGRYYTLIVGANERRWRKVRNKLKVVADSFKVLDI